MIRWFISKTVRDAVTMRKHVQRLLSAQRDVLKPEAVTQIEAKIAAVNAEIDAGDAKKIKAAAEELHDVAEKWIKPYPHHVWRENVEVLLVAIAVAMGIRTFFLQPFKIPTGSMQPTLFGVTSKNLVDDPAFVLPTGLDKLKKWFQGTSYVHVVAPTDGRVDGVSPMRRFLIFNIKQTISIGGVEQTIWFPPDMGEPAKDRDGNLFDPLVYRARLEPGHVFKKGEDVVKLEMHAGDHLFVDRLTYNFRKPDRGEIVVFETAGIPAAQRDRWGIPADQFYIKRLVGLGGETLQVGDDRHLVINGRRLDASTPHFENVYSFDPKGSPQESRYSGHLNSPQMPFFPDGRTSYSIPPKHVIVMGDNTMNSLDSRFWGDFPESSVIGKAFFVYWPISTPHDDMPGRFGFGVK